MVYDPFQSQDSADGTVRNTFFKPRPEILNVRLSNLEWVTSGSRKRPRPEPSTSTSRQNMTVTDNCNSEHLGSVNASNHNAASSSAHPESKGDSARPAESTPAPREVIRYIEKPIEVEPITVMGGPPLVDDRVRQLVHFILLHVHSPNVEIEAKLGTLMERAQGVRVTELVPVLCETPIKEESNNDVRFISDVGEELFYKLNQKLNTRVEETAQQQQGTVRYVRARELDVYYQGRVRQTKSRSNERSPFKVVRTQKKERLGDLNVLCPGSICDLRYSASSEMDCSLPNSSPEMERDKDRISYKFEFLSIDITTVQMIRQGGVERTFEVEVEIDSTTNLFREVEKYRCGDGTSKLFDIAGSLVNTVRLLLEA